MNQIVPVVAYYARTAAISSSNRLKNPISRNGSNLSEYDLEVGERTPLLVSRVRFAPEVDDRSRQIQTVQTTALLGILTLLLFLLLGIIIAVYLLLMQVPRPWPVSHPFYLVERNVWWKQPAEQFELSPLEKRATQNVIILHTRSETCHDQAACIQLVQKLQNDAWSQNGTHIPYNFLVGGDGKTYEGRGWKSQHGFPNLPGINDTIVVGMIGTFNDQRPENVMYAETKALITESIRRFCLSPNYRLFGVIDDSIQNNDAAGLYAEIKEWRHWQGFVTV
ncbi:peptidoglycan-recognition protein 3 isoform X2 [Aedes aegypti]|uniref:Peptidoglycan recognition protein family domain-containing protein n=1 Tax=Aedes aegypti TaxID=7159 RepID=A0A903V707_AEDAE|nr:peptidoglycan-recognition protein 3 isoform X2 [Aedes aegypti]